jgi:hypothetical protein
MSGVNISLTTRLFILRLMLDRARDALDKGIDAPLGEARNRAESDEQSNC